MLEGKTRGGTVDGPGPLEFVRPHRTPRAGVSLK